MTAAFENIYRVIKSYIEINDEEWTQYSSMFRVKKFKKNEIVLNLGEVCRDIFFVNNGLLRVYFADKNGKEHTFHFTQENNFVTDYESFLKGTKSNYSIQAIEDTETVLMSYNMMNDGYENLRYGEKLGRLLAEDYFFIFSNKIMSIYTQSPIERYQSMNNLFPGILKSIPQHYIASYLNITSVHLSRLINKPR